MSEKKFIAIVGAGGIGRAAGLILAASDQLSCEIFIGDVNSETANEAARWIEEGCGRPAAQAFTMPWEGADEAMIAIFEKCDIVLDCLPGSQAPRIARLARQYRLHYANLTEYVKETEEVTRIATDAPTGFILQTGLAPGFINVLGSKLYQDFCAANQVEKVKKISMKVGALTRNAEPPYFYGFTWSPVGVATEYLKDTIVIRKGRKRSLPALSELSTIIIDGVTYEDNLTSGGAADLPDAFEGKVVDLDYKTLRYPGHYKWVQRTLADIPDNEERVKKLQDIMQETIPSVEDDMVIVYASVCGKDHKGILRAIEKSYHIKPVTIGTKTLRAIQSTTAAPLCEAAYMLLTGQWTGPVFQSQIDADAFINGPFVSAIYGKWAEEVDEKNGVVAG
ncbi:MAG: saccharopine dehydrogenase C-terminal domain-containing protein [Bacteroidota bacterium]